MPPHNTFDIIAFNRSVECRLLIEKTLNVRKRLQQKFVLEPNEKLISRSDCQSNVLFVERNIENGEKRKTRSLEMGS